MTSKNSRLSLKEAPPSLFLTTKRVLIAIALIQAVAAIVILAPHYLARITAQWANKTPSQEELLVSTSNSSQTPISSNPTSGKKQASSEQGALSPLQRPFSSRDDTSSILINENSSKTISSSIGNETGIQPGASLGIISVQHTQGREGEQTLKIAIKSRPQEVISVPDVKVQVYFYDQQEEEITASKSPVTSRWLSPPVDWKDAQPELLEVTYQPTSSNADISYAGYIIAVYYKGELQGYQADPVKLTNQFPIKVFIGHNEI